MTQDLTKITTPFGLLDAETQDALSQAYSNNIEAQMQIYTSRGWIDMVVSPEWCSCSTYRIKPKPKVMSLWYNVHNEYVGVPEKSRSDADKYIIASERVCVLRIDRCDGEVSFHREEI